jgi:hypothetical protein
VIEKTLFVDDVPSVLEGYKRLLGRDVPVDTAVGGALGLAAIAEMGAVCSRHLRHAHASDGWGAIPGERISHSCARFSCR